MKRSAIGLRAEAIRERGTENQGDSGDPFEGVGGYPSQLHNC